MPSWWPRSSSKQEKKDSNKEGILAALFPPRRRSRQPKKGDACIRSLGSVETLKRSNASAAVGRSASFGGLPTTPGQPLPLPPDHGNSSRRAGNVQRYPSFPLPSPEQVGVRAEAADIDVGYAESGSASSGSSLSSVEVATVGTVAARVGNLRILTKPDQSSANLTFTQANGVARHGMSCPTSPHLRSNFFLNVQEPLSYARNHGESILNTTAENYVRSPRTEMAPLIPRSLHSTPDPASAHGSSPGSGQNSTVDTGQTSWCHSRASPELMSPLTSPRRSPGPNSTVQSQAVSPLHKRAGGVDPDASKTYLEVAAHPLPLPPTGHANYPPSPPGSVVPPRSPNRADSPTTGTKWQKGKLIGRGSFGNVYVGFDSENVGRMCAMKEVPLLSDDSKSKESVKQLSQEIAMLSRLHHSNIVQYYGSETMEDGLYIYLEYVSGGSIHKLLQEYGAFKEPVIRSYTRQILSGLAFLHSTNTVHRDIKGANILVDTNGIVKLADFGMAKHISVQSFPLSFKGSPYWMAPEVIKPTHGYDLSVDIWSLGCTVLEMATAKPPWSQYEGIAAMFKIGNSKEIPAIPDYLSKECKDFLRLCLQRNPADRPTAEHLLSHPFVCNAPPVCRPDDRYDAVSRVPSAIGSPVVGHRMQESEVQSRTWMLHSPTSELSPRGQGRASSSVSPCASPKIRSLSPHHVHVGLSSSQSSSPVISSGSSTPITGGYGNIPRVAAAHHNYHKLKNGATGGSPAGKISIPTSPRSPRLRGHKTDILDMALGRVPRADDDWQYKNLVGRCEPNH